MFDELGDHIVRIPISFTLDDENYLDRECPNQECLAHFKVHWDNWHLLEEGSAAYCPICRYEADVSSWHTVDQASHINQAVERQVSEYVDDMMDEMTREFNQSQPGNSFFSMSMSYEPTLHIPPLPTQATEVMTQRSTCEECGFRYSSIGAAFFCPACGHNSAATTFAGAVSTVRTAMNALDQLEKVLIETTGKDAAKDFIRHIVESRMEKLVASFQRLAEALFEKVPSSAGIKVRRNAFQNLGESNDLWKTAIGVSYPDILSASEYNDLNRLFQQRHLLAHREGMVDQTYCDKSGDTTYSVDQRLVIRKEAVLRLADLVEKLGNKLKSRT